MSTILEALKKSEQERKLNSVPTLSDMAAPQEKPQWPIWLMLASIVFISVIAILLLIRLSSNPQAVDEPLLVSNDTLAETQKPIAGESILVNVISYSELTEKSFVMINGKMYRENEFVGAGLKVERIEADKVILNLRGQRIERSP